jgi:hypothetical protein
MSIILNFAFVQKNFFFLFEDTKVLFAPDRVNTITKHAVNFELKNCQYQTLLLEI